VSCARARVVAVKIHTEFFAAALSKRAIMEAWEVLCLLHDQLCQGKF
jgi:hypothetical protein